MGTMKGAMPQTGRRDSNPFLIQRSMQKRLSSRDRDELIAELTPSDEEIVSRGNQQGEISEEGPEFPQLVWSDSRE